MWYDMTCGHHCDRKLETQFVVCRGALNKFMCAVSPAGALDGYQARRPER